jgi:DNA gyrase subunit A
MGAATGLGLLDVAILEACEASGATVGSLVKTRTVLDVLHERTGVGPRAAYEPLCDLARPWVLNLPLIEFHGNCGSQDDPPANPRYTQCCLSPLGEAALAAERSEIGSVPIGLINGTTHVDGRRPPLDPGRVAAAVRVAADGDVSDPELVGIVGPPSFPTGCDVDVDLALLASGAATEIVASARIESDGDLLVISHLPPDSSEERVQESISRFVHRQSRPDRRSGTGPGIRSIRNERTSRSGTRIVVERQRHADAQGVAAALLEMWPIRQSIAVRFEQPLATLIRAAASDPDGLDERLAMVERATPS